MKDSFAGIECSIENFMCKVERLKKKFFRHKGQFIEIFDQKFYLRIKLKDQKLCYLKVKLSYFKEDFDRNNFVEIKNSIVVSSSVAIFQINEIMHVAFNECIEVQ